MKKEYIKLDSIVTEIELMQERALNLCTDVGQEYFEMEPEELVCYQNNYRVKNDIVFDYLYQIGKKLEGVREIMSGVQDDKPGYKERIIKNLDELSSEALQMMDGIVKEFTEQASSDYIAREKIIAFISYRLYYGNYSARTLLDLDSLIKGYEDKECEA